MYHVIAIDVDGVPGKLFVDLTYEQAVEKIVSLLTNDPDEPQFDPDQIDTDGYFQYEDGGGIYILCAE